MIEKITEFITDRSGMLMILCVLFTAAAVVELRNADINNSVEAWLDSSSKPYLDYKEFTGRYGSDEFIVVATETDSPLSDDTLISQYDLADAVRSIKGVDRVIDASSMVSVSPFGTRHIQRRKFKNLLIGGKSNCIGMFLFIEKDLSPADLKELPSEIKEILKREEFRHLKTHVAGTLIMNDELDRSSERSAALLVSAAFILSLILLIIILKDYRMVLSSIAAALSASLLSASLPLLFGVRYNMILIIMPPLIFILTLSGTIHIILRYRDKVEKNYSCRKAAYSALNTLILPVFYTCITTSAGFFSLTLSSMRAVVEFGLFSAAGIFLSFFSVIIITPGVLILLKANLNSNSHIRLHRISPAVTEWALRHRKSVLFAGCMLTAVSILLMSHIKIESDVLSFLPENSVVKKDFQYISSNLTGLSSVEIEIRTEEGDATLLKKISSDLKYDIMKNPSIAKVIDCSFFNIGINNPDPEISDMIDVFPVDNFFFSNGDLKACRLSVLVFPTSSTAYKDIITFIQEQLEKDLPKGVQFTVTGIVPLLNGVQSNLVKTQIRSFTFALLLILFLIALCLKSFTAAAEAFLPNLLPPLIMFALMSLSGIPINAATVMAAGIAIGIAVDDTIHFLAEFHIHNKHYPVKQALILTASQTGRAVMVTSVIISSGFAVLMLASFKPVAYFGLLCGTAVITALLADIMLLPVIISMVHSENTGSSVE